eukprot:80487-Lingulodinium_polyedra.AAC.2
MPRAAIVLQMPKHGRRPRAPPGRLLRDRPREQPRPLHGQARGALDAEALRDHARRRALRPPSTGASAIP